MVGMCCTVSATWIIRNFFFCDHKLKLICCTHYDIFLNICPIMKNSTFFFTDGTTLHTANNSTHFLQSVLVTK